MWQLCPSTWTPNPDPTFLFPPCRTDLLDSHKRPPIVNGPRKENVFKSCKQPASLVSTSRKNTRPSWPVLLFPSKPATYALLILSRYARYYKNSVVIMGFYRSIRSEPYKIQTSNKEILNACLNTDHWLLPYKDTHIQQKIIKNCSKPPRNSPINLLE